MLGLLLAEDQVEKTTYVYKYYDFYGYMIDKEQLFWIAVFLVLIMVIWLFWGRKKSEAETPPSPPNP